MKEINLTDFQKKFLKSLLRQLIKIDFIPPLDKTQVEVVKGIIKEIK